jgi:hypothetical protein
MVVMSNDKRIIAEFDRCPNCGSSEKLMESIADEQRKKGLIGKDVKYGLHELGGPVLDGRMVGKLLIGSKVPEAYCLLDCCLACGTIYATRITRGELPAYSRRKPGKGLPPFQMPPGISG